jgi:hypothetical protein
MVTEILAQIRAPSFTAGLVLFDDKVVETAPRVRYMRRWSRDQVREECHQKGWTITVVWEIEREDVAAPKFKVGITQHEESFEVVRADGETKFFYFDDNAGRRAISGRMTKEAAFKAAQSFSENS